MIPNIKPDVSNYYAPRCCIETLYGKNLRRNGTVQGKLHSLPTRELILDFSSQMYVYKCVYRVSKSTCIDISFCCV